MSNKAEYAATIDETVKRLVKDDFLSEALKILEVAGYWIFYRPYLFWYVWRLPEIFWRWCGRPLKAQAEYFTADFPIHRVSSLRKNIGHAAFLRLEREIAEQRKKALFYLEGLKNITGIIPFREDNVTKATYPYLTLLFTDAKKRQKARKRFHNSGLGIGQIYTSAVTDYPYLKNIVEQKECPNARWLAERHITLSTSTFLKEKDMRFILEALKSI